MPAVSTRRTHLYFEGVRGVGAQLADVHSGFLQASPPRDIEHAVVARLARTPLAAVAPPAYDVVGQVVAVTGVARRVPVQRHRGLVDNRDHVAWS